MRRPAVRLLTTAAVLTAAAGLLAGCTATPPAPAATTPAAQAALDRYDASDISAATQTDRFGGYSISAATRTITAYRTSAATADDVAAVEGVGLPAGFRLRLRPAQRSWTTLERLEESLPSRLPADLRDLLSEVDIDTAKNGLDVGLTTVSTASKAALRKALGDSLAKVVRADRATES